MTATVNTVLKSMLHFTYFAQKLMLELIQSLTVYDIIKMLKKKSQNSETVVMNKTEVSGYDVQRFSVLELEGYVHLVQQN